MKLKKFKKNKIFIWASDTSKYTGEGNLALKFLSYLSVKHELIFIKNKCRNKKSFIHKYLEPFYGIILLWIRFINGNKVCYLNYLPLWNFIIFLVLPPKTLLGPITGGANILSNSMVDKFIRKFFFPIFYNISNIIFLFRFKKLIFSTELLKKKIFRRNVKKSIFNFVYVFFENNKKTKKKRHFIIYYKKHQNKNYKDLNKIINHKLFNNFKFIIVGDYLNKRNVINKGYIPHAELKKILCNCKYAYGSQENFFSLFSINALNNNVKLFFNKIDRNKIPIFKNMFFDFFFLKFHKTDLSIKKSDYSKIQLKKKLMKSYFESL